MGKVSKKWNNDGEEDKFLTKLIKEGKITKTTKPGFIAKMYPKIFSGFTAQVIRNHVNELKRRNGLYLMDDSEENVFDSNEDEPKDNNDDNEDIPTCSKKNCVQDYAVEFDFTNYPIVCEKYKDPENQVDKICLVVGMPSGAQDVRIDLNDEGTLVSVKYAWPKVMYNMTDLFKKELANKKMETYHPKIIAIKNGLEKVRPRIDVPPESVVNIKLPFKVQTAMNTWTKNGILRRDGTQALVADFTGYIKVYNKPLSDSAVDFML